MQSLWNIESLKVLLNEWKEPQGIKDWVVSVENTHRRERYFIRDDASQIAVDQDRETHQQSLGLRLLVSLPEKAEKQGEIYKKLSLSLPLQSQVESALQAARQTESDSWGLPKALPDELPELESYDPEIAEDIEGSLERISSQLEFLVREPRKSQFNSAELFLSSTEREVHFSFDRIHRSKQTRIYAETAYSAETVNSMGVKVSDEFLGTRWSVGLSNLELPALFDEVSENALRMIQVQLPEAGEYSVVIDSEVLLKVFNEHLAQLSGGNQYHRLPFVAPGNPLIPNSKGDLLTLKIDPTLALGADTVALSDEGMLQKPLVLVEKNIVKSSLIGGQYAQYLGVSPTTTRGTVVVEGGTSSYEEMMGSAPRVLEILQFSGLFTDANSGTFSSEIRLARLHDRETGSVRYLKGGSLSAAILENFRELKLSRERVHRQHFESGSPAGEGYLGPRYALLNQVTVSV